MKSVARPRTIPRLQLVARAAGWPDRSDREVGRARVYRWADGSSCGDPEPGVVAAPPPRSWRDHLRVRIHLRKRARAAHRQARAAAKAAASDGEPPSAAATGGAS